MSLVTGILVDIMKDIGLSRLEYLARRALGFVSPLLRLVDETDYLRGPRLLYRPRKVTAGVVKRRRRQAAQKRARKITRRFAR